MAAVSILFIVQTPAPSPSSRFGFDRHGKGRHGGQTLQRLSGLSRRFRFSI